MANETRLDKFLRENGGFTFDDVSGAEDIQNLFKNVSDDLERAALETEFKKRQRELPEFKNKQAAPSGPRFLSADELQDLWSKIAKLPSFIAQQEENRQLEAAIQRCARRMPPVKCHAANVC